MILALSFFLKELPLQKSWHEKIGKQIATYWTSCPWKKLAKCVNEKDFFLFSPQNYLLIKYTAKNFCHIQWLFLWTFFDANLVYAKYCETVSWIALYIRKSFRVSVHYPGELLGHLLADLHHERDECLARSDDLLGLDVVAVDLAVWTHISHQ